MTNSETNVAAQAGDEPMLPHHPEPHTHTWSALEADTIRKYGAACRAAGAAQVSPRATADVERNLRAELINAGALRQYCHNDGSVGFVTAYDFDITNRFLAAIATTKPGA